VNQTPGLLRGGGEKTWGPQTIVLPRKRKIICKLGEKGPQHIIGTEKRDRVRKFPREERGKEIPTKACQEGGLRTEKDEYAPPKAACQKGEEGGVLESLISDKGGNIPRGNTEKNSPIKRKLTYRDDGWAQRKASSCDERGQHMARSKLP